MGDFWRRFWYGLWNGWTTGFLAGFGVLAFLKYFAHVDMPWHIVAGFAFFLGIFGAGGGAAATLGWRDSKLESGELPEPGEWIETGGNK